MGEYLIILNSTVIKIKLKNYILVMNYCKYLKQ